MGNVSIITSFDLTSAVTSVIRIASVLVALIMGAAAIHGHELKKHTGGNHDRHAAVSGAFKHSVRGALLALAVATLAPTVVRAAFSLTTPT